MKKLSVFLCVDEVHMKSTMVILVALLFLSISPAWASSITIGNPSFEDPAMSLGGFNNTVTGWSGGNKGVWYPDPADGDSYIKPVEGNQVGWASNSGWLVQWLPDTNPDNLFRENYTYVLKVNVGTYAAYDAGYAVYLLANRSAQEGGNEVKKVTGTVSKNEEDQTMTQLLLEYTVLPEDWTIGRNIGISLDSTGSLEVDFDAVSLTATAIPIPGAFLLLGSGLIGLIGIRKTLKVIGNRFPGIGEQIDQ